MNKKNLDFIGMPNYEIYSDGRVKNIKNGKFLKGQKNSINGYWSVNLSNIQNGGIKTRFYNHRLVAMAFIENPENKKTVNHIDGNIDNNTIDNLEWATQKENSDHAYKILGREKSSFTDDARQKAYQKTSKSVIKLNLDGEKLKEYPSINKAAIEEHISRHSIRDVLTGKKESHKGFIWKKSEDMV